MVHLYFIIYSCLQSFCHFFNCFTDRSRLGQTDVCINERITAIKQAAYFDIIVKCVFLRAAYQKSQSAETLLNWSYLL